MAMARWDIRRAAGVEMVSHTEVSTARTLSTASPFDAVENPGQMRQFATEEFRPSRESDR